ncbi:hypothetical protein TrVE_jg2935 [Triparma verrucosa]|uniref:Ion transport domain-containing protein n=2 Tax=Triparma TaxID=722752 RepID=A0A9W7E1D8_9STRA|nr:hypothetical protein TrST_g1033 [Triparma strigata]GMI09744.1 hypothetical protein TrVE_jg2935 [Triparma verrucosa]
MSLDQALSSPQFELLSSTLCLLASLTYAILTIPTLPSLTVISLTLIEDSISVFFLIEYLLRFLSSQFSLKSLLTPLSIIDLISFLPTLISVLLPSFSSSGLTFLRLLRILRLQRYVSDFSSFKNLEIALGIPPTSVTKGQLQFARFFSSIGTLLFISTGLIYASEHDANPNIPDFFTALYFGLCTLTTVGFGDIVPVTFYGRLVVCFSIIIGVGVVPFQVGELAKVVLGGGEGEEEIRRAKEGERYWKENFMQLREEFIKIKKEELIMRKEEEESESDQKL